MPLPATYQELLNGNARFREGMASETAEASASASNKRQSNVALVACSDSRLDPQAFTQAGPGDLFVVRNGGNIIPTQRPDTSGEVATLEYAVRILGVKHIVVCGHSDCEEMKALLDPEICASLSYAPAWVRESEEALAAVGLDLDPETKLDRLIEANVLLQLDKLRNLEFIRAAESERVLQLHGWIYDLESARINVVFGAASEDQSGQAAA